jgi:alpha-ketoglutaric semialdehyde dehydrogenase
MEDVLELTGFSFIAGKRSVVRSLVLSQARGETFAARNAVTGAALEPLYTSSSVEDLDAAASAAAQAFLSYGRSSAAHRAALLRAIAAGLEAHSAQLVSRAMLETGLPEARLQGEVGRTCGQLRLFASVIEEGSWQNVRIDTALPDRKPIPRPDLRSMLFPVGPVAVFGASNFPLAFSTAGGDTASALAAGNPVIVKAHSAHPGTSELVAIVITEAVAESGIHPGVFSMLYDKGIAIGQALVQHPVIQSVAFTGSKRGGRALMDLAAARESPIPCFTEMSSVNPVFVLPGALANDPQSRAKGLHGSFTLGAGQFCTKPGLIFLPESDGAAAFSEELHSLTAANGSFTMLTSEIADAYHRGVAERHALGVESVAASSTASPQTHAVLFQASIEAFRQNPLLQEEIFGPSTLLVNWSDRDELLTAAESLDGHLTATILGTEADLADNRDLIAILERKVGRLLFNGYPTGVEVSHAMVHGGPYPATSDSRFTSVGSQAILRFVRPRCYQSFPQAALPEELRDENLLGIWRLINGELTRDPIARS